MNLCVFKRIAKNKVLQCSILLDIKCFFVRVAITTSEYINFVK